MGSPDDVQVFVNDQVAIAAKRLDSKIKIHLIAREVVGVQRDAVVPTQCLETVRLQNFIGQYAARIMSTRFGEIIDEK